MKKRMILAICGLAAISIAFGDNVCKGPGSQGSESGGGNTAQSCDPNEISGPLGTGEKRYVQQGEWMDYVIYFENKTNATAAAQEVFVDLPMDANLDWTTLELGEIVFGDHIDTTLVGKSPAKKASLKASYALPGTNTSVKTEVKMKDGVLSWYIRDWDPTTADNFPAKATGGFLPPNDTTGRGEGHLSFRVRVKDDAPNGAVINASATIVFDSNAPIETDPSWSNTVGTFHEVSLEIDGVMTNLTLIAGEPFGELPIPAAREGWIFGGWFLGENGTGVQVTPTTIVPVGDFNLYAYWIENTIQPPDETRYVLHSAPQYGGLSSSYKGCTYNGYALDAYGLITGTFTLAVKKPAKGKNTSAATLTFTSLATGKKSKVNGNVNLTTGEGSGGLAGLKLGANAVGGSVANIGALEGGSDAAKAKDAAALAVLSKFSGKSYVVALGPEDPDGYAQGGYSTLAITMAAKGKAKVSGVLADGTKVSASGVMTVGESYCCVPVIYAKKSKLGFVAWFDRNTRELIEVTALTPWKNTVKPAFTMAWGVAGLGAKGNVAAGTRTVGLDGVKLLRLTSGAIAQTPFDIPLKVSGAKWDAGKAAKVTYKGGTVTVNGANVSGLKLTYTAKTGLFKGAFTVYGLKGGKLVKSKFSVFGAVTGGVGYGTAVLKGKGSVTVAVE